MYKTLLIVALASIGIGAQTESDAGAIRSGPPKSEPPYARCNLTLESIPSFAGVRFGMSYDEIASVYPEIEKDKHFHKTFDVDGTGLFMIGAQDISNMEVKNDVLQVTLNVTNSKLLVTAITYPPDRWKNIGDAVAELSKRLGIDPAWWTLTENRGAELKCGDFNFFANSLPDESNGRNSIALHPLIPKN